MDQPPVAKFQFESFKLTKSYFEMCEADGSYTFKLDFAPKGIIKKTESIFELELGVTIEEKDNKFKAEITASGIFKFSSEIDEALLSGLFYTNAPAILFPYIRAYISALTTLSGLKPINLPVLNLSQLGPELKQNTTTI